MIISAIMIRFTYQFPTSPVSEENGCTLPIRSKPALQNAEILWKMENQIPFESPNLGQKWNASKNAPKNSMKKRTYYNKARHFYNSADLWSRDRVLHQWSGYQTNLSLCERHNWNAKRHKSDSANLNQTENDTLTEKRPVSVCINLYQTSHTRCRCGCEKTGK